MHSRELFSYPTVDTFMDTRPHRPSGQDNELTIDAIYDYRFLSKLGIELNTNPKSLYLLEGAHKVWRVLVRPCMYCNSIS